MTNKKTFLLILLVLLSTIPSASAKEVREIDESTLLINHSYRDERFNLTIRSYKEQKIVIYDLLKLFNNGEEDREVFELHKGKNNLKLSASEINGKSAIRLVTQEDSIALVEKTPPWYSKSPDWFDVEAAGAAGASTGFLLPLAFAFYEKKKETKEPEEIL